MRRRNGLWFWLFGAVFVVAAYLLVTVAVAGSEPACNGGNGEIVFSTSKVPPGFICSTGLRY